VKVTAGSGKILASYLPPTGKFPQSEFRALSLFHAPEQQPVRKRMK
jgi:hypothetical protein